MRCVLCKHDSFRGPSIEQPRELTEHFKKCKTCHIPFTRCLVALQLGIKISNEHRTKTHLQYLKRKRSVVGILDAIIYAMIVRLIWLKERLQ